MKKLIFTACFAIFSCSFAWTQSKPLENANESFSQMAFKEAAQGYHRCLEKDPENTFLMRRIADCALNSGDFEKAVVWYQNCLQKGGFFRDDQLCLSQALIALGVYEAQKEDEKWDNIKDLPFNSDEYSTGHPCVSPDGSTLYFVSNMPGGSGGTDIYMSTKNETGWSSPVNLGPKVNTEGNEMFPYLSENNKMYFSSDGHAGLRGLDIFVSEKPGSFFNTALNLGFPINSSQGDFGMMYEEDNQSGYFSSNRDGKGRDNIYYFSTLEFMKQIFAGTVGSSDPMQSLEGEHITMKNVNTGELRETTLDAQNSFQFTLNSGDELEFFFGGKEYAHGEPLFEHSIEGPLKDTYFDVGDVVLSAEAYAATIGKPLINPNEKIEQENERMMKAMLELKEQTNQLASDKASELEMQEAEDQALNAKLKTEEENAVFPDPRMSAALTSEELGISEADLSRLNSMMTERDMGNVYFAFDSSKLSEKAKEQLKNLAKLIKENPSLLVQISTHTDSRGSKEYNARLSRRRAESVQRYLSSLGITSDQVLLTWHGEEQLVNNCTDGHDCDDLAHEKNRRAEFAFITEEMAAELRK
ncbi:MAG: OmpA family protein [Bacteroidetes bacterium]|nr:OmpA family protein [Bacteroidota bacterium]